jgi:hypothetical protein
MNAVRNREAREKSALHPRPTAPVAACRDADVGIDQADFRQRADGKRESPSVGVGMVMGRLDAADCVTKGPDEAVRNGSWIELQEPS